MAMNSEEREELIRKRREWDEEQAEKIRAVVEREKRRDASRERAFRRDLEREPPAGWEPDIPDLSGGE